MSTLPLDQVASELQRLQKQRRCVVKFLTMQENYLTSVVSVELGYHPGLPEADRKKFRQQASEHIDAVEGGAESSMGMLIRASLPSLRALRDASNQLKRQQEKHATLLPVAAWTLRKPQQGFGLHMLGIVIGEAGNLSNYSNPAKLWKRMGCAAYTFEGETQAGSTWMKTPKSGIPAETWQQWGYNPRRRSVSYQIGTCLLLKNWDKDKATKEVVWKGPYRLHYERKRAEFEARHPDYQPKRCQLHGMLLATKLLLRELWNRWNGRPSTDSITFPVDEAVLS
jgi:hypothetical protein